MRRRLAVLFRGLKRPTGSSSSEVKRHLFDVFQSSRLLICIRLSIEFLCFKKEESVNDPHGSPASTATIAQSRSKGTERLLDKTNRVVVSICIHYIMFNLRYLIDDIVEARLLSPMRYNTLPLLNVANRSHVLYCLIRCF